MPPTVLVTGAAGKTGLAVLRALSEHDVVRRALIRDPSHRPSVRSAGADETHVGDLRDTQTMVSAAQGVDAIYFIAPNVHPDELTMGQVIISAARHASVTRLVYHSVLRPQIEAMPHHWRKMRVEELLFASGLATTVLQPAPYMQNLASAWPRVQRDGVFGVPYSLSTRTALVDLDDVAQVAAQVLVEPGHRGATYELCGLDSPDQLEIVRLFTERLGRSITAEAITRDIWARQARRVGLDDDRIETLRAMFRYYERCGLPGNATVLAALLGRQPASLESFVRRLPRRAG